MTFQIAPTSIILGSIQSRRDIDTQKKRLQEEGQIEALYIQDTDKRGLYVLVDDWPYAGAQVEAARELGWETVLVAYPETKR